MNISVRERPAPDGATGNGGLAARRAVIRWAWRLLRREWRQQLLILALIIVAVAATFVGAAVATDTQVPATAGFGTAHDMAAFSDSGPQLARQIAALRHRFGQVDVIENLALHVPGSVFTYELRAQNPHGPFGAPMLSLVSGHYPATASQVAITSALASQLGLRVGGTWRAGGRIRRVTGIVVNPQNLIDDFALVLPGQLTTRIQTTVLFNAPGVNPSSIGPNVSIPVASNNLINAQNISVTAATLGMLLIALVGVGGFTVLAQRRLRSIGMLGAQGATDRHIGLVVRANGVATGVVGAVAGFALGLLAWLVYRPSVESSSDHDIGVFQLPWLVIIVSMVLAVLAAYFAAARPARAIVRVPIVTALSGRPAAPRKTRRFVLPAGLVFLVISFILMGVAGSGIAGSTGSGSQNSRLFALVLAFIALTVAVVLLSPSLLGVLARLARPAPITVRLALRDLARYRARSGAALGAISLSLLIAVIICLVAAARFGDVLDYVGPNLAANQILVNTPAPPGAYLGPGSGQQAPSQPANSGPQPPSAAQLATAAAAAHGIAAALGTSTVITLETANVGLQRAAAGRNWNGNIYVATPQLLRAFGITQAQVNPDADILTMRPGLSGLSKMRFFYGTPPCATTDAGCPSGPGGRDTSACIKGYCLNNPVIQETGALPSGVDAPNTVVTEHAIRQFRVASSISTQGWLIQTAHPLTASQIQSAEQAAAAAGTSIETRDSIPSINEIIYVATVVGILLALGILAMSVGLVRSETARDLRTLAATGAGNLARRSITAATAGALALAGAVTGVFCGYLAAIGFFGDNQLDGLSELSSIPVANLLLILVGMPLFAVAAGWLLAGRQPQAIGRQPME